MTISISRKNKAALAALRADLSARLEAVLKASGDLETMKQDESARNEEIDRIEQGLPVEDSRAVGQFTIKREQLALLRRRIERQEHAAAPALDNLNQYLQGVQHIMATALDATWRGMVVEAAQAIHPSVGDWVAALHMAMQFRAIAFFHNALLKRGYGHGGDPIGQSRQLLAYLDALLEGKNPVPLTGITPVPDPVPYFFPWERPSPEAIALFAQE